MEIIITIVISFLGFYIISKLKNNNKSNKDYGKEYQVFIDFLGTSLWEGENFLLMKKSYNKFVLQKSKSFTESHVLITFLSTKVILEFYENTMCMIIKHSKSYDLIDTSTENQKMIAVKFSKEARMSGKISY